MASYKMSPFFKHLLLDATVNYEEITLWICHQVPYVNKLSGPIELIVRWMLFHIDCDILGINNAFDFNFLGTFTLFTTQNVL